MGSKSTYPYLLTFSTAASAGVGWAAGKVSLERAEVTRRKRRRTPGTREAEWHYSGPTSDTICGRLGKWWLSVPSVTTSILELRGPSVPHFPLGGHRTPPPHPQILHVSSLRALVVGVTPAPSRGQSLACPGPSLPQHQLLPFPLPLPCLSLHNTAEQVFCEMNVSRNSSYLLCSRASSSQ